MNKTQTQLKEELAEITIRKKQAVKNLEAETYLNDLYKFNTDILDVEEGKNDENDARVALAPIHRELCDFVQHSKKDFLLIEMPRGHLKSTLVTVGYTLQQTLKDVNHRTLIANATAPMAQAFLGQIKNHLKRNEKIHDYWEDLSEKADKWRDDMVTFKNSKAYQTKEANLIAYGLGGSLVSQHYDLIILDDPHNRDNIGTKDRIDKVKLQYKDLLDLLEPHGKFIVIGCLTADSEVLMADGTWKKIVDVKKGEKVWSVNDQTGEREIRQVKAMIPQGKDTVFEVKTKRHSLKATGDHPFLTFGDCPSCGAKNHKLVWKKAKELKAGDFVITSKQMPTKYRKRIWGNKFATKDFYWFFGFLMGDGWVTESGHRSALCACYGEDERVNKKVKSLMKKYVGNVYKTDFGYYRVDNKKAKDLKKWGIDNGAKGKRIPDWIFKSRPSLKRSFLMGFIAADGYKQIAGNAFRIELTNKDLVEDIYKLSLTCSIRPTSIYNRKRTIQPPNSPEPVESETWSIGLVFKHWQEKENKNVCKTPFELLGLRMERITEVEKLNKQEVFDLTVNDTHNFIANGYVVHNTRWHDSDLYGDLEDPEGPNANQYDIFKVRAVENGTIEKKEGGAYEITDGEILWPEKYSREKLNNLLEQKGLYEFSCQYQNQPVDKENAVFKKSWFKHYQKEDMKNRLLTKFTAIDPAISLKERADYTAIVTIGVDIFKNIYILEIKRGRFSEYQMVEQVMDTYRTHKPKDIVMETVAFQKTLQNYLVDESKRRKAYLPIREILPESGESKEKRIRSLQPYYMRGNIFHERNLKNIDYLEDELLRFPRGKHDDVIDALAYAVSCARPPRKRQARYDGTQKNVYLY